MTIRKESVLPGQAPFLGAGEVMAVEDAAGRVKLYVGDDDGVPTVVEAGTDPPNVYAARLDLDYQAADPTPMVVQNDIGAIAWTRQQAGRYIGTLAGAFPEDKTSFSIGGVYVEEPATDGPFAYMRRLTDDTIQLSVFSIAGNVSDAWYSAWIRVEVSI